MGRIIDYASPSTGRRRWRWASALVLGLCVLSLLSNSLPPHIYRDMGWICATCGSARSQKDWSIGITTSQTAKHSKLEKWLNDHQGPHVHDWRCIRGTGINLFGRAVSRGHGPAPPILVMSRDLLDPFVEHATDEQISAFARALGSGTDSEARAAVDAACEFALSRRWTGARPGSAATKPSPGPS